jgi:hypothetical protein
MIRPSDCDLNEKRRAPNSTWRRKYIRAMMPRFVSIDGILSPKPLDWGLLTPTADWNFRRSLPMNLPGNSLGFCSLINQEFATN